LQGVDGERLLLAAAGVAGRLIRVADGSQAVVTVVVTAGGGRDPVDPLGLLVGAGGQGGFEGQDVVTAVVGVLGRLVVVRARGPVNIGLDSLRHAPQVVVVGLAGNSSGVGDGLDPTGGVVGLVADQYGVGPGRHRGRPGVDTAAVGADVDRRGGAVRGVILHVR